MGDTEWLKRIKRDDPIIVEDGHGSMWLAVVASAGTRLIEVRGWGAYSRWDGYGRDGAYHLSPLTDERRQKALAQLFDEGGIQWDTYPLSALQQVYDALDAVYSFNCS